MSGLEMNGRRDWIEANNNYKNLNRDPWTRQESEKLKETNLLLNDEKQIFIPRNDSTQPLTDSQRKFSVYHTEPTNGSASFLISVFNLMNAILGSGILGLAYAMAQLGIVLFFIFLVIVAFLALFAIHFLLVLCDETGVKAYEKLGFAAFGLPGRVTAAVCILMQNIGAMCSYLFIVKYELPNVIMTMSGMTVNDNSWYLNGDYLVVLVTIGIIMPLASLKNIGFLGYTSGFSIFCMFFFTGVIVAKKFSVPCPLFDQSIFNHTHDVAIATEVINATVGVTLFENVTSLSSSAGEVVTEMIKAGDHYFESHNNTIFFHPDQEEAVWELYETNGPQQCEARPFTLTSKWAYSIPTMTFSFVCHTAVLPIYAELKRPSESRMQKVANTSIGICFVLYSLAALFGYLTFFNWMEAEMLLMYSYSDPKDALTLVVRLTVLIAVVLTVPLTHFPARKAITFLLFPNKDFKWIIHIGIMVFLLTFINILVIFVPSIREVFGIIGATASTMLVFVLPCIFFIKLDPRPMKSVKKICAAIMCGSGILLMIESLTVIILGYIKQG